VSGQKNANVGKVSQIKINVEQLTQVLFAEMADWVKQFSRIGTQELTLKERNLVAVAFKYYTGSRRAAWRVLSSIQKKENNKGASENVAWIKQYKAILEEELCNICQECLDLLTEYLIPNS
jgi:14-3-3 protein epsilon